MGEIRKRGKTYWIRFYHEGQRFEESAETDKYETARDRLRDREGEIAKGAAPSRRRIRFEDAAKDLVTDYTVNKKRTLADVTRRVEKILVPAFRGRRLASINTAHLRQFIADRQTAGASNATINLELANIKRIFTLAIQAGKVLHRPYIPMLKLNNTRKGFFERAQFEAVRRHLPAPLDGAVTLAYYTGWRTPSEILTLQWNQIDRKAGVMRLEPGTTKNTEGRTFQYAALTEVRDAIDALWIRHQALAERGILSPFVFCRGGGQRIQSFYQQWDLACTAAGCPGRIPHDFRRTAVRNLNRAGVPETVAMKITGHKTRSVFDRYDITSEEDLADASRKLQALAAATTGTISGTIEEKRPFADNRSFGRKSRKCSSYRVVTGAGIEPAARALKVEKSPK